MMTYVIDAQSTFTLDHFWKNRLPAYRPLAVGALEEKGWTFHGIRPKVFVEAPLHRVLDAGNELELSAPSESQIILVSAAGAVGKSTLARVVAAETGAVFCDLAEAGGVGTSTLSGGLNDTGLFQRWSQGDLAVVVDALDEARLKVNQLSFDDFIEAVARMAQRSTSSAPIVIFGRTKIIHDAMETLALSDSECTVSLLTIGRFEAEDAVKLVLASAEETSKRQMTEAYRKLAEEIIRRLADATKAESNAFVGYAPVLASLGRYISEITNPSSMNDVHAGDLGLDEISTDLLVREGTKLRTQLLQKPEWDGVSEDSDEVMSLYGPDEQLDMLVAKMFAVDPPIDRDLPTEKLDAYREVRAQIFADHPFLDGDAASTEVFRAVVTRRALTDSNSQVAERAVREELFDRPGNPFLAEFYPGRTDIAGKAGDWIQVPAEHVGVIFRSVRAGLPLGRRAALDVYVDEPRPVTSANDAGLLRAEIDVTEDGRELATYRFRVKTGGVLMFDRDLAGVTIDDEEIWVQIGQEGEQISFTTPVDIDCGTLWLIGTTVQVKPASTGEVSHLARVVLEAQEMVWNNPDASVRRYPGADLLVSWPGDESHLWRDYRRLSSGPSASTQSGVDDAFAALRRLLRLFTRTGHETMGKTAEVIEGKKYRDGVSLAVQEELWNQNLWHKDGGFYILDTDRVALALGIDRVMIRDGLMPEKARPFLEAVAARVRDH